MLDQLLGSRVLTIDRSPDFDHFRSIESLGDHQSIPLHWQDFAACFATVALKSCSIFLQRTFPRILQARYRSTGAIVAFGMDNSASGILDGKEVRSPSVLLIAGDAACEFVEPQANLLAFIKFEAIDDRGWPGRAGAVSVIATEQAALDSLRSVTRDILLFASNSAELFVKQELIGHLEESLLLATDHALHSVVPPADAGRLDLGSYLALVRRLDEFLHQNVTKTVRSAELAAQFGVSVRTLNNAVIAIRGLSLHRYVRLRRLWSVRQQLLQGATEETLKAVALANGFWHMGEFRTLYQALFGETPQQTLAVARRR